jgi:arylsulfatase A-like enzyme
VNIIVIMADSLRPDHLGCYGNPWIETPTLDRLARESAVFERAYPEGLPTLPVRAALFTGRYTFPRFGWGPIRGRAPRLAEALRDRGYRTALITDTYHLWTVGKNYQRGFQTFRRIRGQEGDPWITDPSVAVDPSRHSTGFPHSPRQAAIFEQYLRNVADRQGESDYFVAQVVDAGIRWLERHRRERRLFLWLDCFDPHEPWDPPPPYDRIYDPDYRGQVITFPDVGPAQLLTERELRHVRALYAGEVTFVDKHLGRFLAALRDLGLLDSSLLVFLSDHGEPLGERGWVRKAVQWAPEELIRIPLMIRHPHGVGAGKRLRALVQTHDLMPTLLRLARARVPAGVEGADLWPLVTGRLRRVRAEAYLGWYGGTVCVRGPRWKYVRYIGARTEGKQDELFDMVEDPGEKHNRLAEYPHRAADMAARLDRFLGEIGAA